MYRPRSKRSEGSAAERAGVAEDLEEEMEEGTVRLDSSISAVDACNLSEEW